MAILGSVPISGFVAPTDETDIYPSHKAVYGHGGHRSVPDIDARDAITDQRRDIGMTVYVISEDNVYTLKNGIANSDWVIVSNSGGTSSSAETSILVETITADYTVQSTSYAILADSSSNDITITLPDPSSCFIDSKSFTLSITRIDFSDNNVIILPYGTENVVFENSISLYSTEVVNLITNGIDWYLGA